MKMHNSRSALTGRRPTFKFFFVTDSDNTGTEIELIDVACPYYADGMYTHIKIHQDILTCMTSL